MTNTAKAVTGFADACGITLMNQAQAALPPRLRELHQRVLSAFADFGEAPTTAWIAGQAERIGLASHDAMDRLDRADLVHTAGGMVTVAYPFSGAPTPHRVALDDGPAVWAMCAADALGIPLMTGRKATITSTDPHSGETIRIRSHASDWTWDPTGTVMLIAATGGCATAAEGACGHVHFFTSPGNAHAYLRVNPALRGDIYDQAASVEAAQIIFGPLLTPADDPADPAADLVDAAARRYIAVVRANLRHLDAVPRLYRLLAEGEPVTMERLATETGSDAAGLRAELARHPGTDWDDHGRLAGFNLTLRPTPHTFTFDGRTVYAFCADGALELPIVLGRPGVIASPCHATGRPIRVAVTPGAVVHVDPPQAVVSKVSPAEAVADVRAEICGLGHFFTSPAAAGDWLTYNPQGHIEPVANDFEIVRRAMTELGWAAHQADTSP